MAQVNIHDMCQLICVDGPAREALLDICEAYIDMEKALIYLNDRSHKYARLYQEVHGENPEG